MAAVDLFTCDDPGIWSSVLDQYPLVMKKKAEDKKKEELASLDDWYQKKLPALIASRSPKSLTKEEITKLMRWKLMRGKFRPRLTQLVQQNSEDDVKQASEKAYQNPENVKEAIKELSKLKAIGPATASAIMAASKPDLYPFMADEAMTCIPGFKIEYTLQAYIKFQQQLFGKANRLKRAACDFEWTPHHVELALWTEATARRLGLHLDTGTGVKGKGKRKREVDEGAPGKSSASDKKIKEAKAK